MRLWWFLLFLVGFPSMAVLADDVPRLRFKSAGDRLFDFDTDAKKTKPFGWLTGRGITDANLFHLAPLVCLKFRGLNHRDEELRRKVTEGALANYVANSDPDGIDHGLESRPLLAFAVCYVTAHYALDMIDAGKAEAVLDYCDQHLE